ncbi:hypothetical protein V8F06_000291 [Rhypophila decipiens]
MPGLIPLMLGSGNRSSFISPQALPPRNSSLDATTQTQRPRSPRNLKRLSFTPPAPVPVPQTHAEWKKEIAEIKRLHFGKRWRVCSARCNKILDAIKDTSSVEPLFLVYLHFYAATSMEICARPLSPSTAFRVTLLQQAQKHFSSAAALVTAAEESAVRRIRPASVNSWGSSCHSPSESVSSRAWTPDTEVSTPTAPFFSFDGIKAQSSGPVKRVKKVSFSIPNERQPTPVQRMYEPVHEPLVRPDSPTLGFDDEFYPPASGQRDSDMAKFSEVELPLQPMSESERISLEEEAFMAARSIDRYCDLLSSFRFQLSRHSAYVSDMLMEKALPIRSETPDETRELDRQARIERLRKNGWQRKRFDPSRYEELCEIVIQELS